jgi:hypothetical protein
MMDWHLDRTMDGEGAYAQEDIAKSEAALVSFLKNMSQSSPSPTHPSSCRVVTPLIGPVSLYILDRKSDNRGVFDGARVVLLGDIHTYSAKCAESSQCGEPIYQYLDKLFQKLGDGHGDLDFFVELDYMPPTRGFLNRIRRNKLDTIRSNFDTFLQDRKDRDMESNYLLSVIMNFQECFYKRTRQACLSKYGKHVRFHYADVRNGVIHSGTRDDMKTVIRDLQELHNVFYGDEPFRSRHIKVLNLIVKKFERQDVDFFFRLAKIDKQLKKINNPRITEIMTDIMLHHMTMEQELTQSCLHQIDTFLLQYRTKCGNRCGSGGGGADAGGDEAGGGEDPHMCVMMLLAPLFEIYTLARMIRHDMKRVIIYGGHAHITNIRDALVSRLGYTETVARESIDEDSNFQCIRMDDVPQPWF